MVTLFIVVYIFTFPLLISYAENHPDSDISSFIMRFIKSITQGINKSVKDVEQNQINKLKNLIKRKDFLASERHTLLDGILSHLYIVAEENEQRSELSFKVLLEKNLALILSVLFEERGELNRYRAGIFYRENNESTQLDYFAGVSKSDQDSYSEDPLPIEQSIGGKAYKENRIIIFPDERRPFQNRNHKYKSFIAIPIGINDDVEGILTIDCIDENHQFNDPGIHQFLNVLSSVLHLAGSIYRVE